MITKLFDIQRRVVAHKTVESWETIPHAGAVIELDVTAVDSFIQKMRKHPDYSDVHLTVNSVMLKIIAESIKTSPELNAHIEYNRSNSVGSIHLLDTIDIAIPMMTPEKKMITPVLRDVAGKSLHEVCRAAAILKERAQKTNVDLLLYEASRDDSLKRLRKGQVLSVLWRVWSNHIAPKRIVMPSKAERTAYYKIPDTERLTASDLLNASAIVSNVGSLMPKLNCHVALLEIIAPAILAIGIAAAQKQPVVETDKNGVDQVIIRKIMKFTVYFDHRALDGAHFFSFVEHLQELCAAPEKLVQQ
ncbi:MAG: 2-oxo acid dehydrogenase subunit E2 [Candidatus Hydrogenedentes bacterium]|nr:2-oxo acid dehydrogenase subunit E2 [Candidatus Hydrogenedentota bacterium]